MAENHDDNSSRRNSSAVPDDPFQAGGLAEWSVAEDMDLVASREAGPRPSHPSSIDDVNRSDWFDFEEVLETASSVIVELLDYEPPESANELDASMVDELKEVIHAGLESRESPRRPSKPETQEIEILDDDILEVSDPFLATGIAFVDIDTGDVIDTSSVPVLETGFYLVDEEGAEEAPNLGIRLAEVGEKLRLERPWGTILAELRDEIVAESDAARRSAYLYVFGHVVRALGAPPAVNDQLNELVAASGAVLRSGLLDRLADQWAAPGDDFEATLRRLEALDGRDEGGVAEVRRASIAMERLLDGGLEPEKRRRLRGLAVPPETVPTLVARAVDAHACNDLADAVETWKRIVEHADGKLSTAAVSQVGLLTLGTPAFSEFIEQLRETGLNSRALFLMQERSSARSGDRLAEGVAIKRLVGMDVALGKKLGDSGRQRSRLKQETAARLFRLATLLRGLHGVDLDGTELRKMTEYRVLKDAISLSAHNLMYLRRLERWAEASEDLSMMEKSLVSQAALVEEPNVRAVIWERLADHARRVGAPTDVVHDYLVRSLESAPDCLPALISMGQLLIEQGRYDDLLALRGGGRGDDVPDTNNAWRRAELLERTGGDPMEILSLYRVAREDHAESAHLFFCVERALARLGDWRTLRTLYDAVLNDRSRLGRVMQAGGLRLENYRLAVEVFLEDAYGNLSQPMLDYLEWSPDGPEDDTLEESPDQNVLWRVVARERDEDPSRALGRLDVLIRMAGRSEPPWKFRALVWFAHIADQVLDEPSRAQRAYRGVFLRARSKFLQRWAVRGLLRTGDAEWVARALVESDAGAEWATERTSSKAERARMAAELLNRSAAPDAALDVYDALEVGDELARVEIDERAMVVAIRARRWGRALPRMRSCFEEEHHPAIAELVRHIGAALDDAPLALEKIDASGTTTPVDPYVILCELELAYRARDWPRALRMIERGLGTIAAGTLAFRAFLLEQAILVGEWGHRSNELSVSLLQDLWGLDPTVGSSPVFAVAAMLRTYSRMGRQAEFNQYAEYARQNFTPAVYEALLVETSIYETATTGAEAAAWYGAHVETVAQPLRPYYRWMSVVMGWLFGERDRNSVQELADVSALGDPTHRVGPFLLAIAYRDADMYASCERQLNVLRTPGHSRPVQDWVLVRRLFHLAVTQEQPAAALALLHEDETFAGFAWFTLADELLRRATMDPTIIEVLEKRLKKSPAGRAIRLEMAELNKDRELLLAVMADGMPEAVGSVELQAAQGKDATIPEWDVGSRFADLARAARDERVEETRRLLMRYFEDLDEEVLGSPWCPLRLVRGDLSRFGLEIEQLAKLADQFLGFADPEMGAEARLMVARQFLRVGRHADAHRLLPERPGDKLVSVAWSLFNFALDPYARDAKCTAWALNLWDSRCRSVVQDGPLRGELEYETGRYLESTGREDEAIEAFRRSLAASPRFLPSQVAAGRLLLRSQDWRGLATLWETEMANTEDAQALASVAFRVGYLWERRLASVPDAESKAREAYQRVLRVRPNHLPSLHALLRIAYRREAWDEAARYVLQMAEICPDDSLKVSYLCDLAVLREHLLEDPRGATQSYARAFALDPDNVDALLGILRNDPEGDAAIGALRARMETPSVSRRELRDLANWLLAISLEEPAAGEVLDEHAPDGYSWLLASATRSLQRGERVQQRVTDRLRAGDPDDQDTLILADALERMGRARPKDAELDINRIGTHPMSEGRLVAAMHYAGARNELESLGHLAAIRARRSESPLLRTAELAWMAATFFIRGEHGSALEVCEQLLEQDPDFVPAVKIAKFAAKLRQDWGSVVRWFSHDAALSKAPEVAAANRLYASEVQRDRLGDFEAALAELEQVLASDPAHLEAFGKLREILLTRREHKRLLAAYEARIKVTKDNGERSDLLNEMVEIALNHVKDRRMAIGYLGRSLELRPKQFRRLRVLAELYEQEERFDRAVACHRAAAQLVADKGVLVRIWRHIGDLYEGRLKQPKDARNAFARALQLDPESTVLLRDVARVSERIGEFDDAQVLLEKVRSISKDEKVLLEARVGLARLSSKRGDQPLQVLGHLRDVLLNHPEHAESVDIANTQLGRGAEDSEEFFARLTHDILVLHRDKALGATFEMAARLRHVDRAFVLASVAEAVGRPTPRMRQLYRELSGQHRWPHRPLPPEQTSMLLPEGLVGPFIELLRISQDGVFEGLEPFPGSEYIKKANRLKEPTNKATHLAFQWPGLMGLEVRDVHVFKGVHGGSAVLFDGGVRLVLDESWLNVKEPTEHLVALGRKLAGWSMGLGPWAVLDLDAQTSLFIAVVSNYVRGWVQAERSHLPPTLSYPKVQRWLERKGQRVAPYAMEISGRFGSAAIRQQFSLLRVAMTRFSTILIDDPGAALKAADFLREANPGDPPPWLFVTGLAATRIRKSVGVAIPSK